MFMQIIPLTDQSHLESILQPTHLEDSLGEKFTCRLGRCAPGPPSGQANIKSSSVVLTTHSLMHVNWTLDFQVNWKIQILERPNSGGDHKLCNL